MVDLFACSACAVEVHVDLCVQGKEEVLPEVQQFCDRLRRLGYVQSVTPGRLLQGSAYASEFQVRAWRLPTPCPP